MYIYAQTEPGLYTVGRIENGEWLTDSDHNSKEEAGDRVAYLNGSKFFSHQIIPTFTKLEYAAILIAAQMINGWWQDGLSLDMLDALKVDSVRLAQAVLEYANK